ncbi:hypothetical protein GWI33_015853 [Rhynchophorus ferrugineus]|uniref:Uncharacterized protein n=1 Tax=Rhynchophorus ferrugineus TaxID=354439 RepID=A0A834I2E3_RHYFE|nr:hypothetical protein GWI33_015853 [Rhynchophorus ferrugineus]
MRLELTGSRLFTKAWRSSTEPERGGQFSIAGAGRQRSGPFADTFSVVVAVQKKQRRAGSAPLAALANRT